MGYELDARVNGKYPNQGRKVGPYFHRNESISLKVCNVPFRFQLLIQQEFSIQDDLSFSQMEIWCVRVVRTCENKIHFTTMYAEDAHSKCGFIWYERNMTSLTSFPDFSCSFSSSSTNRKKKSLHKMSYSGCNTTHRTRSTKSCWIESKCVCVR